MVQAMDNEAQDPTPYEIKMTANRVRADLTAKVIYGDITPWDVIMIALSDPEHPARQVPLGELLDAQDALLPEREQRGRSRLNAQLLRRVARLAEEPKLGRGTTVGWLVDGRSGGRRLAAWRDATLEMDVPSTFPWQPLFPA